MARRHRDDDDIDLEDEDDDRDEEDVEDEDEDEDEDEEEEEEEEEEREAPPRAKTPIFTIVLLILNFLTVIPFALLVYMDYAARHQWSHATFLNRVLVWGLPLQEEENAPSSWTESRPRLRLDSDRLKEVYTKRPKPSGTPSVPEQFRPVDTFDEPVTFRIRPSQITDRVKRDLFTNLGLGDPVATQEDEISRLKTAVPQELATAADAFLAAQKNDDQKRAATQRILLPLAWNTRQVEVLQQKIAAANGPQLDDLLKDAVQRRMLVDLLAPMNIYRPGDIKKFQVEKASETPLEQLYDLLRLRFDETIAPQYIGDVHHGDDFQGKPREAVEKRHAIAFVLFTVSRLKAPDAKEPVFPKAFDRAQVISGLFEFSQAAANYARALRVLEQRVLYGIEVDREGYLVTGQDLTRTDGFVGKHGTEIGRLKKLVEQIDHAKKRLADLQKQRDRYQKQYEDRLVLLKEVAKKVVEARGETSKYLDELHELQQQLFEAQVQLSDAAERNHRLEEQIRQAEAQLRKENKQ
jgi:hypothetical protein